MVVLTIVACMCVGVDNAGIGGVIRVDWLIDLVPNFDFPDQIPNKVGQTN